MDAVYALAFLQGLGSQHWFTAFAQEKTQHPLVDEWMTGAPPTAYFMPDAERSRYLIMLGTNPWLSHRGRRPRELISAFQRDPDRTLVVVDPRRTETAARADIHLPIKPGTDCYLLLALCAEILRKKVHDRVFIEQNTRGFAEIQALFARVDPRELAERCGLSPVEVSRVALGFATAGPSSLFFDLGIEQTPFSTLNAYLLRLLSAITGNFGRRGGNVYTAAPLAPRLDFAGRLPRPRAPVSGIEGIPVLGPVAAFSPNLLPEEIMSGSRSRIRALIVEGANPLLSYADTSRYRESFRRLELLVVIDPALTETAMVADYVLPAPVGYEKWEWSAFPNGYPEVYAQVRPPILRPPPDVLSEPEIYARLAEGLGLTPPLTAVECALAGQVGFRGSAFLFQALAAARGMMHGLSAGAALCTLTFSAYRHVGPKLPSPALASLWVLSHLFALTQRENVMRSIPRYARRIRPGELGDVLFRRLLEHPGGVEIARLDPAKNLHEHCTFMDRRVRLSPAQMLREAERALRAPVVTSGDFPFVLFTGERLWWNSNTIHRDPAWRKGKGPHCVLRINPADAEVIGVGPDQMVRVETRSGSVEVPCAVDERMQVGHVSLPHGFGQRYPDAKPGEIREDGVNVNLLTDIDERDPFTGVPHHKYVRCRVSPVRATERR